MKNYVNYEPDGRITSTVMLPLALSDGLAGWLEVAEFRSDYDTTHYVEDGALVAYPPKPGPFYRMDFASKTWLRDDDAAWVAARGQRDRLLAESDWVVLRAVDQGGVAPADWLVYRQALRDITNQPDAMNLVWPVKPD